MAAKGVKKSFIAAKICYDETFLNEDERFFLAPAAFALHAVARGGTGCLARAEGSVRVVSKIFTSDASRLKKYRFSGGKAVL